VGLQNAYALSPQSIIALMAFQHLSGSTGAHLTHFPGIASATEPRSSASALRESTGSNNTYVMSASPNRLNRKRNHEPYLPKIITTVGQRPACLVNASVTYVGNDQIYAFGGFDQYTDEGWS